LAAVVAVVAVVEQLGLVVCLNFMAHQAVVAVVVRFQVRVVLRVF
jgi:hypothetical protein